MPLSATAASLATVLDEMTAEGAPELTEQLADGALRCFACGHRCLIKEGKRGICKVRFNEGGRLRVPVNYVAALQCDPTEKKPFFHMLPGSDTLTFGMLGCDLHCAYCQNWLTSQALRDDAAVSPPNVVTPERLVAMARAYGASMVGSSYNEPLITAEWAVEVFKKAKPAGFRTAFISNGNATPQVLDYLRPWTDCYKIDLKSMSDRNYRQLGGVVDNILDTVKMVHERGFWEEIVTLVIPGFERKHNRGTTDSCLRNWTGCGVALYLRGKSSRTGRALGKHLLSVLRRIARRALRLLDPANEGDVRGQLSIMRDAHPGHLVVRNVRGQPHFGGRDDLIHLCLRILVYFLG